ncbi:MAG: ScyD/ScyE family protein [Chroococcus sp. CMT-3BRIN-NPC107]|nr:ScyD/ScyE family protein [Chroococcus sp. CMT-3BRIN-NPC107]
MKFKLSALTILSFCFAAVAGVPVAQAASLTTIVSGISNARAVSFGPDGSLYVGEPGIGGDGNCQPSPSTLFQPICAGNSGSIVKVSPDGQQERILTNFDSLAEQPSGNQGAGPQALEFDSQGNAYLLTGFAGYPGNRDAETLALGSQYSIPEVQLVTFPPSTPDSVLNTPDLAKLFAVDLETGELTEIFDFAEYEITNNPDGGDVVTNPYDLAISGDTAYVVDGGGNAAYSIKLDGSSFTATAIPDNIVDPALIPPDLGLPPGLIEEVEGGVALQSVPTGGAIGPDGAFYVGEYVGFPYPENEARIFRIGEDGEPVVYAEGFTHISDLTFDAEGNLLVLQFGDTSQLTGDLTALPGSLIQVAPDGTRTTLVAAGEGLESADGVTIGPDNQIYVTTRGVGPEAGSVVRVNTGSEPVPEPASVLGILALGATGIGSKFKGKLKQQLQKFKA